MDFRGQTEPNRVFGVVSDGARRYRVKRREAPIVQSLNRGWYRGFFEKFVPDRADLSGASFLL